MILIFLPGVFYLMVGVAGGGRRPPTAGIAAPSRWNGWSGDAFRGSDQGEPPQGGSPTKGGKLGFPSKGFHRCYYFINNTISNSCEMNCSL
jgi:hypothetical protein